ncbi:MAG: hypothetical protein PHN49_00115 [Candidatus Omnitrophica bacterium]|nr:hypothetical protein [Candidatus Omnitrophota bacterium]MDD5670026.1 hypothetical protein [Candidatus Omnitrophota bacterium]
MKNKILALTLVVLMTLAFTTPCAYAVGMKEATASLLLPTTGQAMNGQLSNGKTKIMAGVEVASVTALAILGGVVGGPVIWAAAGPLIVNHVWSAADAYRGAQYKMNPMTEQQMTDAQRMLEVSRQRRFEREQYGRSDIRSRILQAGEQTT